MSDAPTKEKTANDKIVRLGIRVLAVLVITTIFANVLNYSSSEANRRDQPAGFALGLLHGAMMPGAMPQLLLGRDVIIYAQNNNGRLYKLGYTAGVNACGALFFGFWYYRLSRWRKRFKNSEPAKSA